MERVTEAKARWELLETLFHRAMEFSSAERAGRAREWCGEDAGLLTDLLNMLASDSSVEELMASPQADQREGFLRREDGEAGDFGVVEGWISIKKGNRVVFAAGEEDVEDDFAVAAGADDESVHE